MTDQQILERAIQKAIDGGYDKESGETALAMLPDVFASEEYPRNHFIRGLVLDPAFAKALWGEKWPGYRNISGQNFETVPPWKRHLQQMVIAEDPIKYLEEHL